MRTIAPVDKKRQYAAHTRSKRICKMPNEFSSIGLPPVSYSYRPEVDQFTSRCFRKVFEIMSLDSPGDEAGLGSRVDAEYFYFLAAQNCRIRPDDFQVAALTEADQSVFGAINRMAAAGYRFHAEVLPHKTNSQVQVGRRKHEVVDTCRQRT